MLNRDISVRRLRRQSWMRISVPDALINFGSSFDQPAMTPQ